jgi:phosphate transport system protein
MTVREHFENSLNKLYGGILELGTYVEGELGKALTALVRKDTVLAQEILAEDPEVSRRQLAMEDHCITLIATEQPVARDLRKLVASMKVVSNLERIGDHAVHLAQVAIRHAGEPDLDVIADIERMGQLGIAMLHDTMTVFRDGDAAGARAVAARDDEIDALHDMLVARLLQVMHDDRESINQALSMLTLTRFLERLGDHVASICEWIVYEVEGRHVKLK